MAYSKPYLSVAQQIALLQQRGMAITDIPKATNCLSRVGYYRLSGYWYPFRKWDAAGNIQNDFKPATKIDTVVDLYVFDKNLRLLLLDAIERVEVSLRTRIALLLGQYGPLGHRDPTVLDGTFARVRNPKTQLIPHQVWLDKIDVEFDRSKEEFVKHFKTKYAGDYPPIWISCEVWDFGSLSHLFAGLAKADQTKIAKDFSLPNGAILKSWIRTLNVARNSCAHHGRVWNRPTVIQPKWPTATEAPDLAQIENDVLAQTRLYGVAAILRYLLRTINPATQWGRRFKDLMADFPADPSLSLQRGAGFPVNWDRERLWQ